MEKYNLFCFNPCRYEEQLSSFGKNVLKVMIQDWNSDRYCNKHAIVPRTFPAHHKKVLRYNGDSSLNGQKIPLITDLINSQINLAKDTSPNFTLTHSELPETHKSRELVKTVAIHREHKLNGMYSDDLIYPVSVKTHKYAEYNVGNRASDDEAIVNREHNIRNGSEITNIGWNDIFDTELLSINNIALEETQHVNSNIQEGITFNAIFSNEVKSNIKSDNSNYAKGKLTDNKRITKRNNQSKINITAPKKLKKLVTEEPKTNYRKQKYTLTVKNWLHDVDSNNSVEREGIDTKNRGEGAVSAGIYTKSIEANVICTELNVVKEIMTEKVKTKKKKVVQAQLANKDGVMKFTKPKNLVENKIDSKNETESKSHDKISVKERKTKTKFIAPIKSQIPVKEVTYNVYTIDENNVGDLDNTLLQTENKEVVVVLIYSNGYSQLNRQHTEDSCVPEGIIINIDDAFYNFNSIDENVRKTIVHILKHNKIICYEGKNVLIYLTSKLDLEINTPMVIDAKIGGSLLDPDNPPDNFTELQNLLSFVPQYTVTTESVLQKSAWYMTLLKECVFRLIEMLVEKSLWNVFVDIEMRLLPIIADMEQRGVTVDLERLKSMENILMKKLKAVEQECYNAAGRTFQINSTVQVRAILYDELQLDTKCCVKIRETMSKGAKSTSETMLRSLVSVHPLPKLILEYRHLRKAHATFLSGIAQHVKNGIVRPTWAQTAAATGRIASNNPNLQAIPKASFSLVMFPETEDDDIQLLSFRSVYTARGGHTFLAADFKHVECRVFAHFAADTSLLEALKSKTDLFKVLAAKWLRKPESDVSSEDRDRTKRIIYASLYGAGARKLMDILGISYEQALTVTASFNRTFPSLKSFGRSVVARCEQHGGRLSTLCGRARRFNDISNYDFALRSHAERQAVNFVVQGSAADLCKVAMIMTEKKLRDSCPPVKGHLVLQIHDELVWEIHDEDLDRAAVIIKQVMENCGHECGMSLRLPVAVSVGKSWGDMVEYTPNH